MNIHMYHQFTHVDLRGMYNGFLIPLWPRAALWACGLSAGFNGFRWIILVGLFPPLTWIKHQYHLFEDIFPYLFAGVSSLLTWLSQSACVCTCACVCVCVWEIYSHRWLLCEEPQRVWSLTSPSHFRQIKVWKVSPEAISPSSGWVKNVYEGCVSYYL